LKPPPHVVWNVIGAKFIHYMLIRENGIYLKAGVRGKWGACKLATAFQNLK
jgi:hypothetical protein